MLWQLYPPTACLPPPFFFLLFPFFFLYFILAFYQRRGEPTASLTVQLLQRVTDFPPDSSAQYYQVKSGGAAVLGSRRHRTGRDAHDRSPPRKQTRSLMSKPLLVLCPLLPLLHPDGQIGISGANCYRIIVSHFECLTQLRSACHFLPEPFIPCSDSEILPVSLLSIFLPLSR